jgi:hypothetical protein
MTNESRTGTTDGATDAVPVSDQQGETLDLSSITMAELTGESFETFANYFIVEAICEIDRRAGTSDTCRRIFGGGRDRVSAARIRLTINGVDVPFLQVLRRFHADLDRFVKETAVGLIEEEFGQRTADIYALMDDLKLRLRDRLGLCRLLVSEGVQVMTPSKKD